MLSTLLLSAMLTPNADPKTDKKPSADEAIHQYLVAETKTLNTRFMDGAKTKAEWEAKRPKLKEQFLDMMGLWPLPEKTPLKATVTGTLERGSVVIEKLHYQSRPGLYVTANLYRPKTMEKDKKLPAILYVCGHSGRGRDGNKTAFQDHGLWFANNGYVCLVVDSLQLGEVAGKHHGTYNLGRFWWHSRGYTPAGVECWNGVRGIDYLCSLSYVDADRIGVTGISGGGASTSWIAAADDRVKVAVPVSGMSDLESYVSNKVINGHCDCMFLVNTYQWEWTTILALHAPKPMLFANSDNDRIFPMDGNRRIIERLRRGYEMLGAKDHVDEYVSVGGHDYRPDLRLAIFGFFHRHLKKDNTPVKDADFPNIEGKQLRVFPEDTDLPKDSINDKADELFIPVAEVKLPAKQADYAAWKSALVAQVKERSFRGNPAKSRITVDKDADGMFPFFAEQHANCAMIPLRKSEDAEVPIVIVVLNPEESAKEAGEFWTKHVSEFSPMGAVSPRGSGTNRWTTKNPPNTVERSFTLLGKTVDAGRVHDVIAGLDEFGAESKRKITLVGKGSAGVIAAYAALLRPESVSQVMVADPPTSHRDGPQLLNIQRVLDIPDALGLLAPGIQLTLINAKDKAFDKTSAIYRLAGAEGKWLRK